jgi:nicotinamide-nucleotide amidase
LHLSNAEKTEILGVSEDLIKEKTVVSEEVAQAMSLGCQKLFKTDIALSTTGVAYLILMNLRAK